MAALAVLICPLMGALTWMAQMVISSIQTAHYFGGRSLLDSAWQDPWGLLSLIGIGWLYALVLTIVVGLPLGYLVAFLLRYSNKEGLFPYLIAGAVRAFAFSMVLPSRSEFWLPITVTGLLMGISYWYFVRRHAGSEKLG